MKEKLISRLVMGALVGLTATGAFAGQIQSSSVSIAREVITTDTQAVTSPRISYRFAGDVDARSQTQTFQVQFTLGGGAKWVSPLAANVANIVLTDGVSGATIAQVANAAAHGAGTIDYSVTAMGLSADATILYATLTVHQDAVSLVKQPLVTVSGSAVAAQNPTVQNLKTLVGTVAACDTTVKTLPVSVKHYVALSAPASLATDATATPDEHTRGGATNTTTLITFPTNIKVNVAKSIGNAKIDVSVAGQSLQFAGTAQAVPPTAPVADSVTGNANIVNLGSVYFTQQAQGYDSNLADQYLLGDLGGDADGVAGLVGVAAGAAAQGSATATPDAGALEVTKVDVTVSATQGFVTGGALYLSTLANCSTALGTTGSVNVVAGNAAGPITLSVAQADVNATFGAAGTAPVYVCYRTGGGLGTEADAATPIPTSSFTIDAATIVKATGPEANAEQNNSCNGPLFALSGSVKIDVRNFANAARTDGWMSIVRLINNSESRTANVYGQYIHADGKYGKWGKIATLAPRAVSNMTSSQIDALLTSAPAHATAANNAAAAETPHNATTQDAPRLRITTADGNTLRVQNYLFNPASQNFIEASSSQGVDFTGSDDRAPSSEGQYQDQDAQVGLNGGN